MPKHAEVDDYGVCVNGHEVGAEVGAEAFLDGDDVVCAYCLIDRLEVRAVKRGRALRELADMLNSVPGDKELWGDPRRGQVVLAGDLYHLVSEALRDPAPKPKPTGA